MGKLEKLLQRIKNNPKQVRFEELDKIFRHNGFTRTQPGGGSSHYTYKKEKARITIPFHQPHIKAIYVERAIQILEGAIEDE